MMFSLLSRFGFPVVSIIAVAFLGYSIMSRLKANRLQLENARLESDMVKIRLALGTCSERLKNIKEDAADDSKIDNLDDLLNFDIPPEWMLPETKD